MRPLHIGLLVVGAALAGGLAVKMSEPQPIPLTTVAATAPTTPPAASPVITPAPDLPPRPPKPSPMPDLPLPAPPPAYSTNRPKLAPVKSIPPQQVAESKPLPVYNSPPQFVTEAVKQPVPKPATGIVPPRQVVLHSGTPITVRIDESLSSDRNAGGDTFEASLADPLVTDGLVIAERGAHVNGRVVNAQKAGHAGGNAFIELGLTGITTSDGQHIAVLTEPWTQRGDTFRGEDAAKIGGGAALGAIIGAVAGGGKGAAIGAGAGGLAGAGVVAATRGRPASISSETIVRFSLATPVTITERR